MIRPFVVYVLAAPFVGAELAAIIRASLVPGCQDVRTVCDIQSLTDSRIDSVTHDNAQRNVVLVVATSGWELLTKLWRQRKPLCSAAVLALDCQNPNTCLRIATATAQGVRVFLTTDDATETLNRALAVAARGEAYTSNRLKSALRGKTSHSEIPGNFPVKTGTHSSSYDSQTMGRIPLSQRQREVALLAAEGLSNKEIAGRLFIDVTTVKTHLEETYRKIGICRRSQLVHNLITAL